MSMKVPISYTNFKNFPGATEISKKRSLTAAAMPIMAIFVFVLLSVFDIDSGVILFGIPIAFLILGYLFFVLTNDRDTIKGIFTGLDSVSKEQRREIVNHFMNGKILGNGDLGSAMIVGTICRNLHMDLRNKRITHDEYCEKLHEVFNNNGIKDVSGWGGATA